PRFADDAKDLAGRNVDADRPQGRETGASERIAYGQVAHLEHWPSGQCDRLAHLLFEPVGFHCSSLVTVLGSRMSRSVSPRIVNAEVRRISAASGPSSAHAEVRR